jgi:hypothetical protein
LRRTPQLDEDAKRALANDFGPFLSRRSEWTGATFVVQFGDD